MSALFIILIILAIYVIGVFIALFLDIYLEKKIEGKNGGILYRDSLPGAIPLLSWILVIIQLGSCLMQIESLFNKIAIKYYGKQWCEAKENN